MIRGLNHKVGDWTVRIADNGDKRHQNPNKYNLGQNSKICKINGCNGKFSKLKHSGLCKKHDKHGHDLLLVLEDGFGQNQKVPAHKDIIDCLLQWSRPRNYNLLPLFQDIAYSVLGNVPDVTTLAGEVDHGKVNVPSLQEAFDSSISIAENYFPEKNRASFQPLLVKDVQIPIIVLVHVFIGLTLCEEANRGDRWFFRNVIGDESETRMLGGAMSIAYFAAQSFGWGVQLGKASKNLMRVR